MGCLHDTVNSPLEFTYLSLYALIVIFFRCGLRTTLCNNYYFPACESRILCNWLFGLEVGIGRPMATLLGIKRVREAQVASGRSNRFRGY